MVYLVYLVCLVCLVFWLNQTNRINQMNQTNQTNQINQMDQIDRACPGRAGIEVLLCRNGFSAACYVAAWDLMTDSSRFKLSG